MNHRNYLGCLGLLIITACAQPDPTCLRVTDGFGPEGEMPYGVQVLAEGLSVPWSTAFLPSGDLLVTERDGQLRLLLSPDYQVEQEPVFHVEVAADGEGGLLGLALHPDFSTNRLFYMYYTRDGASGPVNRVERFVLSLDQRSASSDRVIIDDIPAAKYHNGGRLRFDPDGMLVIGTGDAREPSLSQDLGSLAGKVLRVDPDGGVPADNPFPGSPVWALGARNVQGFDWLADGRMILTDHGPSGDLGRSDHDEVNVLSAGDNLGWPDQYACNFAEGRVAPSLTFGEAVPPGGAALVKGDTLPAWQDDLLIGALGAKHLHRVRIDKGGGVEEHEVLLLGDPPTGFGRLRDVLQGPDGAIYITTSNCDGRGECPPELDQILRIGP